MPGFFSIEHHHAGEKKDSTFFNKLEFKQRDFFCTANHLKIICILNGVVKDHLLNMLLVQMDSIFSRQSNHPKKKHFSVIIFIGNKNGK